MVQVHMVDPASGVPIPCDGECLTAKGMKKYVPHGVLELYQKISYSRGINEKPAKVKVSGETDTYADRLLCIYVNENTFRMITGTEPVPYAINLKRNDLVSQREYLAQVQKIIGGMPGTIISDQEALRDENASNRNALVPLLIMICCVLAFCAMISVGAASALDAENRIGVFRTLSVLGASGGTLRRTACLAPLIRAAMSLLIGVGCGVALAEKAFMTSSISQLNTTAFLYITGITAVFAILYVLPYLRAVSRVIHERTPDGGKEKK